MRAPETTLALVRTMANRGEVIDPFGYVGTTVAGTEVHSSLTNVLSHMPLRKIERTLDGRRILLWEGEHTPVEQRADEIEVRVDGSAWAAINAAMESLSDSDRSMSRGTRDTCRLDAAAWLLVAQRMLAREAGR